MKRIKHFKTETFQVLPDKPLHLQKKNVTAIDDLVNLQKMAVWVKINQSLEQKESDKTIIPTQKSILIETKSNFNTTTYSFDRVFQSHQNNHNVFSIISQLIGNFLEGYNITFLSYGTQSSNKTSTYSIITQRFLGNSKEKGVIQLTLQTIFQQINNKTKRGKKQSLIKVSCIMLDFFSDCGGVAEVRDLGSKGVVISKQVEVVLREFQDIEIVIRKIKEKKINSKQKSSHLIIQILLQQRLEKGGLEEQISSKILFVDLASPQVQSKSTSQSLLVLNNCISELAKPLQSRGHVPFRNCKLTRILKDSLDGNCKTIMLATILDSYSEQVVGTLNYAFKCTSIRTKPKRNSKKNQAIHIANYQSIITALKQQNQAFRKQLGSKSSKVESLHHSYAHFENLLDQQVEYYAAYNDAQDKINKLNLSLKQQMLNQSPSKLSQQLDTSLKKYQSIHKQRLQLMTKIKNQDRQLFQSMQQKLVQFQMKQLTYQKIRSKRMSSIIEGQNKQVDLLIQQLKKRDSKIAQQKDTIRRQSPNIHKNQKVVFPSIEQSRTNIQCMTDLESDMRQLKSLPKRIVTQQSLPSSTAAKNPRAQFKSFLQMNIKKYQQLSKKKK